MKHPRWFAPATLIAGLASAPSLAHGGASVAVGLPPVSVDVGDVHIVVGAPPPPPVVVVQEPPPPEVVVREVVVREVVVREAPRSTVVVYPRHRVEPVVTREIVVVEERDSCDRPGKHKGHHKGHHSGDSKAQHPGHGRGLGGDPHGPQRGPHGDNGGGYWR